ncbi:lysoplasmalogenase family protein [Mariniluteicoccus flavus]
MPYVLMCAVHLVLLAGAHPWAHWTQMLLMPALVWAATRVRRPLRAWVLGALFFAWVGDSAPRLVEEPTRFLVMAGGFLLAQLCWVCGLGNRWSLTIPARRRATGVLYVVAAIAIAGFTVPFAGSLAPAVAVYALALTAAAMLATSMGELGTWGGLLSMTAGGLIALDSFFPRFGFGGLDVLIMFTYVVAQGLLVAGAARIRDPRTPRLGDTRHVPA